MRSLFAPSISLAVASFAVLAACSDRDQTTAPTASTPRQANYATAISDAPVATPNAKPQAGFSKVERVAGALTTVAPGMAAIAQVTCPVGTTMISGGYYIGALGSLVTPAVITLNQPNVNNGWSVRLWNPVSATNDATFFAVAMCAS